MLENLQNILKNKDSVVVISASILVCLIGVFIGNNLHDNDDDKPDIVSEIIKEDETDSPDSSEPSPDSSEPSPDSSEPSPDSLLDSSEPSSEIDDLKDKTDTNDISDKDNIQLKIDESENDNTGKGIDDDKNELEDQLLINASNEYRKIKEQLDRKQVFFFKAKNQ